MVESVLVDGRNNMHEMEHFSHSVFGMKPLNSEYAER